MQGLTGVDYHRWCDSGSCSGLKMCPSIYSLQVTADGVVVLWHDDQVSDVQAGTNFPLHYCAAEGLSKGNAT
eukprot:593778-Pelagomonas_calceolata.AAC.4